MRWLDGISDSVDTESEQTLGESRIGKPGMVQFMGLQRIGPDLATEQKQKHQRVNNDYFFKQCNSQ